MNTEVSTDAPATVSKRTLFLQVITNALLIPVLAAMMIMSFAGVPVFISLSLLVSAGAALLIGSYLLSSSHVPKNVDRLVWWCWLPLKLFVVGVVLLGSFLWFGGLLFSYLFPVV